MTKYTFDEKIYNNYADAEKAVYEYADNNIDDAIDGKHGNITILGNTYPVSRVLKLVDGYVYKKTKLGYARMLLEEYVETIEINDIEDDHIVA